MVFIAHWAVVGSRSLSGDFGPRKSACPEPFEEKAGYWATWHDRSRDFFPEHWEMYKADQSWYHLAKCYPLSSGVRGAISSVHILMLPAEWVEGLHCDLESLIPLFPKREEVDIDHYKTGEVQLPGKVKDRHDAWKFVPQKIIQQLIFSQGRKIHFPTSIVGDSRAAIMCRFIDALEPEHRNNASFITTSYEQAHVPLNQRQHLRYQLIGK